MKEKKCNLLYLPQLLYIYPLTLNLFMTIDVILRKICFCPFRMFFWSVSPSWVQHPMKTSELRWVAFHTYHHNTALLVICVLIYLFCVSSISFTFILHLQISNSHEWRPARVCVDVSEEVISTCPAIYIIRKMKFFQFFISFWSCLCPFRVMRVIPPHPFTQWSTKLHMLNCESLSFSLHNNDDAQKTTFKANVGSLKTTSALQIPNTNTSEDNIGNIDWVDFFILIHPNPLGSSECCVTHPSNKSWN